MGQLCPNQAIELQGWAIEPIQQQRQLALQIVPWRRLKMQYFPADGTQTIGPYSKKIRVPPVQGCKRQWLIELSSRGQQELHQTLHLGAGLPLWQTQRVRRQPKTPGHRRSHLSRIQLFSLNGCRAEALAADQRIASKHEAINGLDSLHGCWVG